MPSPETPPKQPIMPSAARTLVLIGGGHAHVAVIRGFATNPLPCVELTVIGRDAETPYSGMLPGLIAGHYTHAEAHIDVAALCRFAGARFIHDEATGLDLACQRVLCRAGPPVPYDCLSIDIGASPSPRASGIGVKPIAPFLAHWEALCARALATPERLHIGVVGAGAGGVELVLALQVRLEGLLRAAGRPDDAPRFSLFGQAATILPGFAEPARRRLERILHRRGIGVFTGQPIGTAADGVLQRADGTRFPLDDVIWATGGAPAPWLARSGLAQTGLALDPKGFIAVHDTLQSTSHPTVFAAGDIASVIGRKLPKSGVYAVRQGKPLAANLRRALSGQALVPFRPQRHALALIGTGDCRAIAVKGTWSAEGRWVWLWKDWVDRRFMRRYTNLADHARADHPR
ncbi:MAG: FAD-dependent oxidoreductase [Proteobacteria bacterium]|nr:FAD-dependent oxidoreductase [Pseudomonadota bacterium]